MLLYILIFLLLITVSMMAFAFFARSLPQTKNSLTPFAVLPVADDSPSTKAFLEFYASQIAWMDNEILYTVLLVYPESRPSIQELCEDMARQYDFFSPVSLTQAEHILQVKLKNSEIF